MLIIHKKSDDEILAAIGYLRYLKRCVEESQYNGIYLFLALERLHRAEVLWRKVHGEKPMRREWQILRRYVMSRIARMTPQLVEAGAPEKTEDALRLRSTKKRASLAYRDDQQTMWIWLCLTSGENRHASTGRISWEIVAEKTGVKISYLKKLASEWGITARKRVQPRKAQSARTQKIEPQAEWIAAWRSHLKLPGAP